MQRAWQEFRTGWHDARWSSQMAIVLAPVALVVALAVQISRGQVPRHVVSLFYAGLVGFAVGIAVAALILVYRERLKQGLRQLLLGARAETNPLQKVAGAKGGEATQRSHRRRV